MAQINIKASAECAGGGHITLQTTGALNATFENVTRSELRAFAHKLALGLVDGWIDSKTAAEIKTALLNAGITLAVTG